MMELTVNEAMDLVQESNLFESPKRAVLRLLEELQSRRAAEREQAAPQGDLHGETYGEACCRFTKEVDEMRRKVAEALGVCEEAAPTEPRLAKWERRLDRMSGGLHFNYSGGEGWYASWMIDGGVVKYAYGDTPKAAVKAAWKAWREAQK